MTAHLHFKPPEKGKTPKKITTKGTPGGPFTPGAKKERKRQEQRDKDSLNTEATRAAGTAPDPLISDATLREEKRLAIRRTERGG